MRFALSCLSLLGIFVISGHKASASSDAGETFHLFQLLREPKPVALAAANAAVLDVSALQEMLRGSNDRPQHWNRAPELTVLATVMQYHEGEPTAYAATSEQLTDQELDGLTSDLTAALASLTDNTYQQFSAIHRESVMPGTSVRLLRPGQIVVGRYRDVQNLVQTIGYGGRAARVDGTITGAAIILDSDYDRTSAKRRLLRTHELGHALGYNHVQSQISIMNPSIGPELTEFDRRAAKMAFPSPLASNSN